jgi:predicted ATPase
MFMKIEIVSGQQHADIENFFNELLSQNKVCKDDKSCCILSYPEHKIAHQTATLNYIRGVVDKCITENRDLFILTYSDHILNGIRLEIKKHQFEGAVCHQILDNGEDYRAVIDKDGHMSCWANDVFDTWDIALTELLTN